MALARASLFRSVRISNILRYGQSNNICLVKRYSQTGRSLSSSPTSDGGTSPHEVSSAGTNMLLSRQDGSPLTDVGAGLAAADVPAQAAAELDMTTELQRALLIDAMDLFYQGMPPVIMCKIIEELHNTVTDNFPTCFFLLALMIQPVLVPLMVLKLRQTITYGVLKQHVRVLQRYSVQERASHNIKDARRARRAERNLLQEYGFRRVQNRLLPIFEVPFVVSSFFAGNGICNLYPEVLKEQGFLWIPSLLQADPYFILPIVTWFLYAIRVDLTSYSQENDPRKWTKRSARLVLASIGAAFTLHFPAVHLLLLFFYQMFSATWSAVLTYPPVYKSLILRFLKPNLVQLMKDKNKLRPLAVNLVDQFEPRLDNSRNQPNVKAQLKPAVSSPDSPPPSQSVKRIGKPKH